MFDTSLNLVLVSTLDFTELSYSTRQFVRFSALLENVQKMESELDKDVLTDVYMVLIKLRKSPELQDQCLLEKLNLLIKKAEAGLHENTINSYRKKLVDFVRVAAECYEVSPVSKH